MSSIDYMTDQLHNCVSPPSISSYVNERIRDASRKLRWPFSRTRDLWYNDGRYKPSPEEILDIETYTGIRYGKQERSELDTLISRAAALNNSQDADFASAFIDAVRAVVRSMDRS